MDHYEKIGDLMTLLGDFPLPEGEVLREGDRFRFTSDVLEVEATFEKHPSGVVRRHDRVKNVSQRPITIRTALSKFVFNAGAFEVYTQYNENNGEGQEGWQKLVTEVAAHGKELRCSFENAPFMALYNVGSGRGMAFHMMDCCLWTMRTRKVIRQVGQKKTVTVEAGVDSSNFSLVLEPGQDFELPAILFYPFRNPVDMDAYKLHRYCNETYMPKPLPVVYNTWMSRFDEISYDLLAQQVPLAKKLGMEYFVIDAGWFGEPFRWHASVGDWREYTEGGMAGRMQAFAELVRQNGMKFGLWFEIERASLASDSYKAHPEYYLVEDGKAFLDFANDAARQFALDTIKENVEKYGIEYIKFDFNATATYDARGAAFLPYFQGYGEFIRLLRQAYPNLYLEGCASGGMRIAPATLQYYDCYWLSDQQKLHDQMEIYKAVVKRMPNKALITWITIQSIPDFGPCVTGGTADKIVTGDGTWAYFDRTTPSYIRAAMLGGPIGISCDLTKLTEEVLDMLAEQIALFKQERNFWEKAECRVLQDTDTAMVLQYNDPAFAKVKLQVYVKKFRQSAVTVYPVCVPGTYSLEDGTHYAASTLEEEGLEVPVVKQHTAVCLDLTKQ
jgi:alpha-galactosidase